MASNAIHTDGYLVLPILMPALPSFPYSTLHEIRLRPHTPKVPTEIDTRTLFLKNIPIDSTESHLRAIFGHLVGPGRFEAAFFEDGSRAPITVDPARVAHIDSLARKRKRSRSDVDGESDDEQDAETEKRRAQAEAANLPAIWDRLLHRSGSSAVVLLADEKSVSIVLKAVTKLQKAQKYPTWGHGLAVDDAEHCLGSSWISRHLIACQTQTEHAAPISAAVRTLFEVVNQREKQAALMAKRLRNEPDEDGFVTVTRGSSARATAISKSEADDAKRRMAERAAKRKEETTDFYRFQRRQRLKMEHDNLKSRFEEDRQRVRMMREKRGIKPQQ